MFFISLKSYSFSHSFWFFHFSCQLNPYSIWFAVFRYNANGSPDTSFGLNGGVATDVSLHSAAFAIALQSDGKIVAAGAAASDFLNLFFGLARYNPDGSLDPTVGFFGRINTSFTTRNDFATGLAIQGDGRILAAGLAGLPFEGDSGFADFAVARYKPNCKLDASFGVDGRVVTDFLGRSDRANAVALQSDGKIVLAGVAQATTNVFAVARYLVEDFTLGLDQPVVSATRGTTVSVEVSVNHVGGFTGSVTLTPPDGSAIGVKVKPASPITTTHPRITVNLKAKLSAQVGAHQITFTGRDDEGRVRAAVLTLNIQ